MNQVLSFGYEKGLLQERHKMLVAGRFEVTSVAGRAEALQLLQDVAYKVVVVGHAVPEIIRNDVARRAKDLHGSRLIFLYRYSITNAELADAVLSVDGTPEALVETIALFSNMAHSANNSLAG